MCEEDLHAEINSLREQLRQYARLALKILATTASEDQAHIQALRDQRARTSITSEAALKVMDDALLRTIERAKVFEELRQCL